MEENFVQLLKSQGLEQVKIFNSNPAVFRHQGHHRLPQRATLYAARASPKISAHQELHQPSINIDVKSPTTNFIVLQASGSPTVLTTCFDFSLAFSVAGSTSPAALNSPYPPSEMSFAAFFAVLTSSWILQLPSNYFDSLCFCPNSLIVGSQ
ncbi:hypothetical protein ACFX13_019733 [Malus domestica]